MMFVVKYFEAELYGSGQEAATARQRASQRPAAPIPVAGVGQE
jgi:hypothetical protein